MPKKCSDLEFDSTEDSQEAPRCSTFYDERIPLKGVLSLELPAWKVLLSKKKFHLKFQSHYLIWQPPCEASSWTVTRRDIMSCTFPACRFPTGSHPIAGDKAPLHSMAFRGCFRCKLLASIPLFDWMATEQTNKWHFNKNRLDNSYMFLVKKPVECSY